MTAGNRRDPLAWEALAACDLAEFRADTMVGEDSPSPDAIAHLLREFREEGARRLGRIPETLVTLRLRRDGGSWPDERAALREPVWNALVSARDSAGGRACEWIDVEIEAASGAYAGLREACESAGIRILVSHHNFGGSHPPPELRRMLESMLSARPAGVKFALTCHTRGELIELLAFAREVAGLTAWGSVFSMGGPGRSSRVLAPLLGCPFTYGYLTGGPVAPGQLSAAELRAFFAGAPFPPAADNETLIRWADGRLQEAGLAQ